MVRNYIRKSNRGQSYAQQDLEQAVDKVKSGQLTAYRASIIYKIPKNTIRDHVIGRRGRKSSSYGRPTCLALDEEKILADAICVMEKWGFGLSRKEILEIVGVYVKSNDIKTNFRDGVPGEDWFLKFSKRHNLSIKKAQSVEYARKKSVDPFIMSSYFDLLENTISELNLQNRPSQIWNLDETSFCSDPSKTKVVGKKGLPSTRTTSGPGRENTTVLFAANAAGGKAPPLIVFKGKSVWDQWTADEGTGFQDMAYAATSNGWMEAGVFRKYLEKTFVPCLGQDRPVLLLYDGHATHVGLDVIQFAIRERITILKLPPHSSHLLQPLDLTVFRSLKGSWDEALVKWQRKYLGTKLSKKGFSQLIGELWDKVSPDIISSGFRKGGIVPYNREIIPKEMFDPITYKRWLESRSILENPEPLEQPGSSGIQQASPIPTGKPNLSFEELMLSMLKKSDNSTSNEKPKKRRIAAGAEVITKEDVILRLKDLENEKKRKRTPKGKERVDSETSEDEGDAVEYQESSDEENLQFIFDEENTQLEENNEIMNMHKDHMEVDDWVLVKFPTKKSVKYYVGQIVKIDKGEPTVRFLRKIPSILSGGFPSFKFPEIDDSSVIAQEQILLYLPNPTVGRRGQINFKISFEGYNIQ